MNLKGAFPNMFPKYTDPARGQLCTIRMCMGAPESERRYATRPNTCARCVSALWGWQPLASICSNEEGRSRNILRPQLLWSLTTACVRQSRKVLRLTMSRAHAHKEAGHQLSYRVPLYQQGMRPELVNNIPMPITERSRGSSF